jgi:uncharacterized protein YxjI
METTIPQCFSHPCYTVRRKVFKIFGGAFHIYDPQGELALFCKMKAFKLKEDIRLYTGPDMLTEVLLIQARKIIDFSSAYDVTDPRTSRKIGALRRKGLKSIIRDEWVLLNDQDDEVGRIREDSAWLAVARRIIGGASLILPQKYHAEIGDVPVCTFQQHFNPFVFKLSVDFSPDTDGRLDRRLGLAAAVLLAAIEGRQD